MVIEILDQYITNPFLRFAVLIVLLLVVLRAVVFLLGWVLLRVTAKTKTEVDDLLVKKTSSPITLILFLIGIRIALEQITLGDTVKIYTINILYSLIVVAVSYVIYVFLDLVILRAWKKFSAKSRIRIEPALASLIHGTLKIILVILAALYILDLWGVEIGPFLAGLGIAGLAVALAFQSTLSNILGGVSIIMDKSVRVGDLVYLDAETSGRIMKIGLRSTKIQTFDNELIIVPNSKLADGKIQNVALPEPKTRVVVPFGVAYGSDIEKVKKIVLKEIKSVKRVVNDPEPSVKFLEMADSSLNFKAYFYVESFEIRLSAVDEANTKIYNALNKNKIEIPFPQMDVHVKK